MDNEISLLLENAENDAAVFSLLAAYYNNNPGQEVIDAACTLDTEGIEDKDVKKAIEKIKNYASSTFPYSEEEKLLNIKRDWTKLFRAVSPDYGPKAPYEEMYLDVKNKDLLKKLASFYLEHDYTRYPEVNNRHDYIGIQLDFVAFCALMRIEALKSNNLEEYERITGVSENFISNHIAAWFPKFCTEAFKFVRTEFYKGVLGLTYLTLFDKEVLPESYYTTVA